MWKRYSIKFKKLQTLRQRKHKENLKRVYEKKKLKILGTFQGTFNLDSVVQEIILVHLLRNVRLLNDKMVKEKLMMKVYNYIAWLRKRKKNL